MSCTTREVLAIFGQRDLSYQNHARWFAFSSLIVGAGGLEIVGDLRTKPYLLTYRLWLPSSSFTASILGDSADTSNVTTATTFCYVSNHPSKFLTLHNPCSWKILFMSSTTPIKESCARPTSHSPNTILSPLPVLGRVCYCLVLQRLVLVILWSLMPFQ